MEKSYISESRKGTQKPENGSGGDHETGSGEDHETKKWRRTESFVIKLNSKQVEPSGWTFNPAHCDDHLQPNYYATARLPRKKLAKSKPDAPLATQPAGVASNRKLCGTAARRAREAGQSEERRFQSQIAHQKSKAGDCAHFVATCAKADRELRGQHLYHHFRP